MPEVRSHSAYTCQVVRYIPHVILWHGFFLYAVLSMPWSFFQLFSPNSPPLTMVLSSLIFFSVTGACSFQFLWGLMAGLGSCTSRWGIIRSRGWLPKVETPGYSRRPTAINPSSPNIHIQILQTGLHTFP